jgi:hypothetical protein
VEWSSFHSVEGGEMAGLRQNVGKGKGKGREALAEAILIMNIISQHQDPKFSSIANSQENYIATRGNIVSEICYTVLQNQGWIKSRHRCR